MLDCFIFSAIKQFIRNEFYFSKKSFSRSISKYLLDDSEFSDVFQFKFFI